MASVSGLLSIGIYDVSMNTLPYMTLCMMGTYLASASIAILLSATNIHYYLSVFIGVILGPGLKTSEPGQYLAPHS